LLPLSPPASGPEEAFTRQQAVTPKAAASHRSPVALRTNLFRAPLNLPQKEDEMGFRGLFHLIHQKEDSMLRRTQTHVGLALLFLATFGATSSGKTLIVGQPGTPCPNAQYTTITGAVNAANAGDVVAICPALYPEQLIITKPLTLRGLTVNGVDRVLLQPALVAGFGGLPFEAVIAVTNTRDVTIENLAIAGSNNTVSGCAGASLAGIHYYNSSGRVENNAIFGAEVANPQSCTSLLPASGFGVEVDADQPGPFCVSVQHNSIHDYTRDGVYVTGSGVTARIEDNTISGVGPSIGTFQFAVWVLNGAVGLINRNVITEGLCGTLSVSACINLRSEGVTLKAVGDGTVVDSNVITNAQNGIFINDANRMRITNNLIRNIDALSGMDIQGTASGYFTNSLIDGNSIFNVGPIDQNASSNEEGCGINEYSGTSISGNTISNNTVNDAYCGVAAVGADRVGSGAYFNTLYTVLDSDLYPISYPPPVEP
jgi:nitrous oxidase accessory protein NosD